jgi:ATP-binding cassette, subfamily C, bacterial LapB
MFGRKTSDIDDGSKDLKASAYMSGGNFDLFLASVFINILSLAMPLTLLQVYDRILPNSAEGTLILLVVGIGIALIFEAFLRMGRSYVSGWMGARFDHLAGTAAIERFLGVSILEFDKQGAGQHLERYNALNELKEYYAGQALLAIWDFPFALIYLGAMAFLAGWLFFVPVVLIILFATTAYVIGGKLRDALSNRMGADDRRFSFIIEVLGSIHTVKGLAMEEQMIRRYERLQETSAEAEHGVALRSSYAQSSGAFFSQLVLFSVVGFGSTLVIDGKLTVGGLAACTMLAGRSMQPMQKLVGVWTRFQSIQLARDRLRELFQMRAEKPAGLPKLPKVNGDLELENLTFTYGKSKDGDELPPQFEDINLKVRAGEIVGISGANASGKTTLLYLMMGIYEPTIGSVRIDGMDLMDYEPSSIRTQASYLPQEAVLFDGTLLENLTMFREDKVDDAMDMSKLLGLDNVVAHMPQGYDSPVGDGAGDKLPRGIKQRIAIARALVDKPRILLFDEANTSMDGAGDAMLRGLLDKLRGRVTLILVSSRPSMLNLSDRIFDIEGHHLIERGVDTDQLAKPQGQVTPA